MTPARMTRFHLTLGLLALAAVCGAWLTWTQRRRPPNPNSGTPHATPIEVAVYTNPGATTPQIPLWGAIRSGRLDGVLRAEAHVWKTAAHLQSLLLAGEGDVWIGHVDGFARARARGAPVVLLAVTGWRKFALVSRDPAVTDFTDFAGRTLPYAPVGCPSVDILRAVLGGAADRIAFEPHDPKQLALRMLQGTARSALLPEPVVTTLLGKIDGLRVVANVEDAYARINGGLPRMPIAGIAMHARLVRTQPRLAAVLLDALATAAQDLAADPERAADVLPEAFAEFVPREVTIASLTRDIILLVPAAEAREEVLRYLRIVTPELFADGAGLDEGFFAGSASDGTGE